MEDGYRIVKRVVIVLICLSLLNLGLRMLAQTPLIGSVLNVVYTLIVGTLMLRGNNIARWLVVLGACISTLTGIIGYTSLGGQLGYFHWVALWLLCFVAVYLAIAGFLVFNAGVNVFFET